jgi:site-specific DNA-methyltransferase (adenine-specific)
MSLYNKDVFKTADNVILDDSIPIIATDPPYQIGYGNHDWDKHEFVDFTERWVELVVKKMAPNGTMWAFMAKDNAFTWSGCEKGFVNICEDAGLTIHMKNWVGWARQKGRGASKHLKSQREELFHFTKHPTDFTWHPLKMLREVIAPYMKDGRPRGWFLDEFGKRVRWTGLGNMWTYSSPQWNGVSETQFHPSQKPVMMMERIIRLSSNERDIVFDPFMGSGSTAIGCLLSDRQFIGFENNKKYFDFAENRYNKFDINNYPGYNYSTDIKILSGVDTLTKKQKSHIANNIPKGIKENFQKNNIFF